MKFAYEYRTAANERRFGEISAASRDAAYAALKARGIRPARLTDAPGVFNRLFGHGKRWLTIAALVLVCLALAALVRRERDSAASSRRAANEARSFLDAPQRRQIIGDAAVIEKGIRTGWADVFTAEGDRFLASFAVPGYPAAIRVTTEEALKSALAETRPTAAELAAAGQDPAVVSLEARQVRAIVTGMKAEARALLASGWTLAEIGAALAKRQDREIAYYEQARRELEAARARRMDDAQFEALWEAKNAALRAMGIRLLALPED